MVYERVAREIRKRKITQKAVAEDIGMSQGKLSLTLSGKRKMSPEELFVFCRYLDCDPNYFSDDLGPEEEEECEKV